MDRTSIIAVAVAVAVLFGWEFWYAPKMYKQQAAQHAVSPGPVESPQPPPPGRTPSFQPAKPLAATEPSVRETIVKASSASVEYEFTNIGGGIEHVVLLQHEAEQGGHVTLNEFGSVPIGAISTQAGEGTNVGYTVTKSGGTVVCERTAPDGLRVVKKFTLPTETSGAKEFIVNLDVTFENTAPEPYHAPVYYVYVGSAAKIHQRDLPTYTAFDWYAGKAMETSVMWFDAGRIPLVGIQTSAAKDRYEAAAKEITWVGVKSQYFTTMLTPLDEKGEPSSQGQTVWARRFPLPDEPKEPKLYGIEGALAMPGFELKPGETHEEHFQIYSGPKDYRILKQLGDAQSEIMKFGMFKIVSIFLLKMMNTLKGVLGSFAAAIIVMTFIIRGAMWPLQNKANQSMKRMQALQPKMTELREKYKDDPTKMNQELMKLYRDYGASPFAGCLPMFVQIPVFFGFYAMLGTAIELRGSHFLWVKDLSQPDTVAHIAGFPVNILPLCMAATMLVQMQLTPKSGDAMQQRIFMFVPLIFISFCYNFASALALYWTVQNLFSIVQLYITKNQPVPALKKIASPNDKKRGKR